MHTNDRPTGQDQKLWAMICAGTAVMFAVFGWQLPTERYGQIIPVNIAVRFWLLVISGGFIQLAVLLWLTSIIVRAIWFLPGRDAEADEPLLSEKSEPATAPRVEAAQNVASPEVDVGGRALIFALLSFVGVIALCIFWGLASGL